MNPVNRQGFDLFMQGSLAFAATERVGIRVDVSYVRGQISALADQEEALESKLYSTKAGKEWKRTFGSKSKLGSVEQLRSVLKTHYEIDVEGSLDEEVLREIDIPFTRDVLKLRKIHKARTTYLDNLLEKTTDGFLHPFFNLVGSSFDEIGGRGGARTYRSSSQDPNFHNIPAHDPLYTKIIRQAIISREDHCLVEADYSGIEVKVGACYHKDPTMLKELETGYDMHRELAAKCYLCKPSQVSKDMRFTVKNSFTFASYYGSYWRNTAPNLWKEIGLVPLMLEDGTDLYEHLDSKGIKDVGSFGDRYELNPFEKHIKKMDDYLWIKKYPGYAEWRQKWYEAYEKQGYFNTLTGFCCRGHMNRKAVCNYPIQGSSFHVLLWSFIQLHKEMKKRKMRSVLIGQIHDSILGDIHKDEVEEYVTLLKEITTKRVREHWDWLILPLEMGISKSSINGNWYQMEKI
jgi:DNA polymerase-1